MAAIQRELCGSGLVFPSCTLVSFVVNLRKPVLIAPGLHSGLAW